MNAVLPMPSVPASPTPERGRIALLDALRGLSILGIAVVNVFYFAVPLARLTTWQWNQVSISEGLVRSAVTFLAEYQFAPIFAVLFGMGLALQYENARRTNRSFVPLCSRRLLILLALGIAHGMLLWYGDILALYALLGFVVLALRNRSSTFLLVTAIVLLAVPVLLRGVMVLSDPHAPARSLDESRALIVAAIQARTATPAASAPATRTTASRPAPGSRTADDDNVSSTRPTAKVHPLVTWIEFLADDERIYRSGTVRQMLLHRRVCYLIFAPWFALTHMGWSMLGSMLLGVCLFRRGWFLAAAQPPQRYRRLALMGIVPGAALQFAALALHALAPPTNWAFNLRFICTYLGAFGMSLGYLGIVALLFGTATWQRRLKPLAAVGRMSLTNYIGSSVLFGLVFYGYGLGLMSRVSLLLAELIALVVVAFLTTFSVIWLRRFQYGPLEWLWRVLTYWRYLPVLRRPPE